MNGLLSQGQGSPAPAAPQQPAPQQQPQQPEQPSQDASPEQKMYETVVGQSAVWIYKEGLEHVRQKLRTAEDPADAIGDVVGTLLAMNVKSAGEQGKMIPPFVVVQGSMDLITAVMEIAVKDGVVPQEEAKEEAAESFYEAMSVFGEKVGGSLDGESRKQYAGAMQAATQQEQAFRDQNGGSLTPQAAPQQPVPTEDHMEA